MDRQRASTCPGGSDPGGTGPSGSGSPPGRGADPGPDRPGSAWHGRGPGRRSLTLLVVVVLAVAATPRPVGASPRVRSGSGATALSPGLVLLAQTPWVTPGGSFDLHLRSGPSTVPAARLGVAVAVYPCLSSISGFDQSVESGPTGTPVSATPAPVPLDTLPAVAGGGVDLSMPVAVGDDSTQATGAPFTIHLLPVAEQCQSFPAGVFPVRVELVDTVDGAVLGSFTTHLVFSEAPASTQRLRVGVVLPVQITRTASRAPSSAALLADPDAALATPAGPSVDALSDTVATIAAGHPDVPVTLQVSGQTVGLLAGASRASTLAQLTQLASTPAVHQLTAAPYVPVDAAGLVGQGLSSELALQVARGIETVDAATGRSAPTAAAGLGPWITGDGVDAATVAALAGDGFREIVLPTGDLTSAPAFGSTTQPFTLAGTRAAAVTAMASDDDLTARFTDAPGDPVLAAHQLAAELAQLYYERPNGVTPRAVLAVAPTTWTDDPDFVDALLGALDGNPLVQAMTVSQVFALYPSPAACRTTCRPTGTTGVGVPATEVRDQRIRVNGFADAAVGARTLAQQLGDLVLGGESQGLRPAQQTAVLANAGLAVDAQLGQLLVEGNQTVTLTASTGLVPVTVYSGLRYPVTATLTLSSDKLLFPNGETQWSTSVVLQPHHSNVVSVRVRSRTSGVSRLDIALRSPDGSLHLAAGELSVRSTSSSVVGVVLTVGAVLVLAIWWFRTSVRRRTARRAEEEDLRGGGSGDDTGGAAADVSAQPASAP